MSENGYLDATGFAPSNGERDFFDPTYRKPFGVRALLEEANNLSGLNRLGGSVVLDTAYRLGLSSHWDYFSEHRQGASDEAVMGDVNLLLRVAQHHSVQVHAGLGARGWFDNQKLRGGFNFLYSVDYFPLDPVVLSTTIDLGHLNHAFLLRVRPSIAVQWSHAELFAGYDWLRIGKVNLHGPMLGIRLWF